MPSTDVSALARLGWKSSGLPGAISSATDPFVRNFTTAQDRALRGLIDAIRAETAITRITGHNDHAAKACPGFVVRNWINRA
ncbi:hypothetical protein [Paracoccus sp. (in: a-proteobacteria)]|uniref:hypothetical protein n=1 Tax=Paracoccus sp. TaxID=267 RepID=UPI0035B0A348